MFEVWLNSTWLKHLVVTENLKISRIVIKMGLREREEGEEKELLDRSTCIASCGITFNLSELRISERISFSLASLTK